MRVCVCGCVRLTSRSPLFRPYFIISYHLSFSSIVNRSMHTSRTNPTRFLGNREFMMLIVLDFPLAFYDLRFGSPNGWIVLPVFQFSLSLSSSNFDWSSLIIGTWSRRRSTSRDEMRFTPSTTTQDWLIDWLKMIDWRWNDSRIRPIVHIAVVAQWSLIKSFPSSISDLFKAFPPFELVVIPS